MSQFDLFSEPGTQHESLAALFDTMMQMTDDPLADPLPNWPVCS